MEKESESTQFLTQRLFGKKAQEYSNSSLLVNQSNLDMIIDIAGISGTDKVLDVATGTGFLALAIADTGAEVVATDFTKSMLEKTRELLDDRNNASLALTDADSQPFSADSFDVVACRVAVHHFANPQTAFSEMTRVCKNDGRVVVMDVVSAEDKSKSELHNKMAKLRDPSEFRQWRISELEEMLSNSGLSISKTEIWTHVMEFDEWIRLGGADETTAEKIRTIMIDSMDGNKAGLNPVYRDGELVFTWTTAIILAQK
ncbi:class I SAM-dependent methyltransferase [Chloroflexota bacterium]